MVYYIKVVKHGFSKYALNLAESQVREAFASYNRGKAFTLGNTNINPRADMLSVFAHEYDSKRLMVLIAQKLEDADRSATSWTEHIEQHCQDVTEKFRRL